MKSFIGMVIILSLIFCGISFAETPQEEGSRKLSSVMATQVNNYEHLVAASINGLNDHEGTPDGLIVLVDPKGATLSPDRYEEVVDQSKIVKGTAIVRDGDTTKIVCQNNSDKK